MDGRDAPHRNQRGGARASAEELDLPPDPADLDLEEAEGEAGPVKKMGLPKHLMKRKRKYGKYTRKGGDRKVQSLATASAAAAPASAAAAQPASFPSRPKQPTKKELRKQAGYAQRELRRSRSTAAALRQQLNTQTVLHQDAIASQSKLHEEALAKRDLKIAAKSSECLQLSTLAQARRKDLNTAMNQCDSKIASMEEQHKIYRQEADQKVMEAESDARQTIRAERAFLHNKLVESDRRNNGIVDVLKKSHEQQLSNHEAQLKQADGREQLLLRQLQKQKLLRQLQKQKLAHQQEVDRIRVEHKAELARVKQELRAQLAAEVEARRKKIDALEQEQVEMMDIYNDVHTENEFYRKSVKESNKRIVALNDTSLTRLNKMREYRDKHRVASDQVVSEKRLIV